MRETIRKRIEELDEEIKRLSEKEKSACPMIRSIMLVDNIIIDLRTRRKEAKNLLATLNEINELEDSFNILKGRAECLERYEDFTRAMDLLDELENLLN
jgi:hypothetical protein